MTVRPSLASAPNSAYRSFFAPMSMPRVGSFSSSTLGPNASQRAMITFCWLPPESVVIECSGEPSTIPRRST